MTLKFFEKLENANVMDSFYYFCKTETVNYEISTIEKVFLVLKNYFTFVEKKINENKENEKKILLILNKLIERCEKILKTVNKQRKDVNKTKTNNKKLEDGALFFDQHLEMILTCGVEVLDWFAKNDILGILGVIWEYKNVPKSFKHNLLNFWNINLFYVFMIMESGPR